MTPIERLQKDRRIMVRYLRLRIRMQDWHGVRDAAADLEQIDARLAMIGAAPKR